MREIFGFMRNVLFDIGVYIDIVCFYQRSEKVRNIRWLSNPLCRHNNCPFGYPTRRNLHGSTQNDSCLGSCLDKATSLVLTLSDSSLLAVMRQDWLWRKDVLCFLAFFLRSKPLFDLEMSLHFPPCIIITKKRRERDILNHTGGGVRIFRPGAYYVFI